VHECTPLGTIFFYLGADNMKWTMIRPNNLEYIIKHKEEIK